MTTKTRRKRRIDLRRGVGGNSLVERRFGGESSWFVLLRELFLAM